MFKQAVKYFYPSGTLYNDDYQRRMRIVTYAIFIALIFSFFYAGVSFISDFHKGIPIMLTAAFCHVITLFLLKGGSNIGKVANLFGCLSMLTICAAIYHSGGIHSPLLPLLAFIPIVMPLIAAKKSNFFWPLASAAVIISIGLMDHQGFRFSKAFPPSGESILIGGSYLGLIGVIILTSVAFENARLTAYDMVNLQKEKLANALSDLKETQSQLIYSEKMASLGELTAGIAHEIQTPLNFVNNFSDLSLELATEMDIEINKKNYEAATKLSEMLKDNVRKIDEHGIRATNIVKDMLHHSQKRNANKVPVDINKLAVEYLRLCYYGWRAKDKSLVVFMKTNVDENVNKINIVQQDIGRALLNIYNNSFYAMNEKRNSARGPYQPNIMLITEDAPHAVRIIIKDNGNGIPADALEKIFLPFFTTKPTGQGSGLGLSISYDIITKGHGGQLKVKTEEGLFTQITISLPKEEID